MTFLEAYKANKKNRVRLGKFVYEINEMEPPDRPFEERQWPHHAVISEDWEIIREDGVIFVGIDTKNKMHILEGATKNEIGAIEFTQFGFRNDPIITIKEFKEVVR